MLGRKLTMPKKQSSLSNMSDKVLSSEPFSTFVSNAQVISSLLKMTSSTISKRENELKQSLDKNAEDKKHQEAQLQEDKDELKELYEMKSQIGSNEELERLIGTVRALLRKRKKFIKEMGSYIDETCRPLLDIYQKQKSMLMPMVFVYMVTIWDAFIMDTVRKILEFHPQLITANKDATIEVSKAFLWSVQSIGDVRNHLIEDVVRDLDYNRKKLVEYFLDYWGIDWEKSGVPLDDIIEIRARRDIWVHNKGMVNKQYLDMVDERTSFEEGQVAEIDTQYIDTCLHKLTRLAVYIHATAYTKHYAKTDIG